jgi:hypothetical protein
MLFTYCTISIAEPRVLSCRFPCSWVSNGVVGSPVFAAYDQGRKLDLMYPVAGEQMFKFFPRICFYVGRLLCFPRKSPRFGFKRAYR